MSVTPLAKDDFEAIARLTATCVHCGFCLSACPTYGATAMENDSPRGRIWLLAAAARDQSVSDATRRHIDRCIGCEACVPACPSGVRYDELIEIARRVVNSSRPKAELVIRAGVTTGFAHAKEFGAAVPFVRAGTKMLTAIPGVDSVRKRAPRLNAVLGQASMITDSGSDDVYTSLVSPERGRVALLTGCIADVLFREVNRDTIRVLNAEGFSVIVPRDQGCCGALAAHAGRQSNAQHLARRLIEALDLGGLDAVVTNSAGCGAMMKDYGELLDGEERAVSFAGRVVDIMEFLARYEALGSYAPMPRAVVYHAPCHLAFAQGVRTEPRTVLSRIPELELLDAPGPNCCGAGGMYSVTEPELARQIGEAKRDAIAGLGADLVVSGNPGCTLQLNSLLGDGFTVVHPISLLAGRLET